MKKFMPARENIHGNVVEEMADFWYKHRKALFFRAGAKKPHEGAVILAFKKPAESKSAYKAQ